MAMDTQLLEVLLEERAILNVLHQYCHAMDYGLDAEWVAVFADDGVFDVRKPTGETMNLRTGRDQLATYIASYPKPPASYNKHFCMDPMIKLDGDEAIVSSYFLALRNEEDGKPALGSFGRFTDRLRKIDGEWRIANRVAEVEAF